MNTALNTPARTSFTAFAFAALLTIGMLAGVDGLAVSPAPQALLAQTGAVLNA